MKNPSTPASTTLPFPRTSARSVRVPSMTLRPFDTPCSRLQRRLRTCLQANERWETLVTIVLGAAGLASIVWAVAELLDTHLP